MIGWVQGIQSIVDTIDSSITALAGSIPNLDLEMQTFLKTELQQNVNPSLGTYWALGVLLIFFGFVLVARGDRKPSKPPEPLLPPQPPVKQQE